MSTELYEELEKIEKATSGLFKGKAKRHIANELKHCKRKLNSISNLPEPERREKLNALLNAYTNGRNDQLAMGANSFGHPGWAAMSACEGWLQLICLGYSSGDIAEYVRKVDKLIARGS